VTTASIFNNVPVLFLYVLSAALVIWAVTDVVRRPSSVMPPARKAVWIIASIVGWLLFGLIGAAVAVVYLVGPRRRLNAARW
jgi:hypothetical protein